MNTIRVPNCFDPDQDQRFVGPDMGPNCLQMFLITQHKSLLASKELSHSNGHYYKNVDSYK